MQRVGSSLTPAPAPSAAPNRLAARNNTIWAMSCASPHITEAMVKPAEQRMKDALRRSGGDPSTGAVLIAAATM